MEQKDSQIIQPMTPKKLMTEPEPYVNDTQQKYSSSIQPITPNQIMPEQEPTYVQSTIPIIVHPLEPTTPIAENIETMDQIESFEVQDNSEWSPSSSIWLIILHLILVILSWTGWSIPSIDCGNLTIYVLIDAIYASIVMVIFIIISVASMSSKLYDNNNNWLYMIILVILLFSFAMGGYGIYELVNTVCRSTFETIWYISLFMIVMNIIIGLYVVTIFF